MILYFQLKPYVNAFQSCLKDFKLKKMVVEPKATQMVELNKEPIDLFNSTRQMMQKSSLYSKMLVWSIEVVPHPVEYQSRDGQGVVKVQWSPTMY